MKTARPIIWPMILALAGLAYWLAIPEPSASQAWIKAHGLGIIAVLIGLTVIGFAMRGIFTGIAQIAYHHGMQKYSRKREPIGFWLVTAFEIFGGIFFIIIALKDG